MFGDTLRELIRAFGAPSYRMVEKDGSVLVDSRYRRPLYNKLDKDLQTCGSLVVRFDSDLMVKIFFSRFTIH
ncbi:hypothetical protein ABDK75_17475 [Gluconobacter sp. OJA]|uniref:hypothetical protein n=1 Tax=Acetobacteraceae TaxID=433 RepID=UPI0031F7FE52